MVQQDAKSRVAQSPGSIVAGDEMRIDANGAEAQARNGGLHRMNCKRIRNLHAQRM